MPRGSLAVCLAMVLSGCATVLSGGGQDQTISLETQPAGALCVAARDGVLIGTLTTPGSIVLSRSRKPIDFHCLKEGYLETDTACTARGNMIMSGSPLFDLMQLGVDASTGAAWEYPTHGSLSLIPDAGMVIGQIAPPHYPQLLAKTGVKAEPSPEEGIQADVGQTKDGTEASPKSPLAVQ